jgi:hypothetical protein
LRKCGADTFFAADSDDIEENKRSFEELLKTDSFSILEERDLKDGE